MEEEEKGERVIRRFGRRVNLFKKRKKPLIRKTVQTLSQRNYLQLIINIVLVLLFLLILIVSLYILRRVLLPKIISNNQIIITPQGSLLSDSNQIKNLIQNSGLEIDTIYFASDASSLTFNLQKNIYVLLSLKKDIRGQIDLVEAISRQLNEDGKRAIYIDLRYNKPIVKF